MAFIFWFRNSKVSNNCLADFESNAPVGSSASISLGFVIIALADAILCFCPPDTWYGYFFRISLIPSFSAISFTLLSISLAFTFPNS